MKCLLLLCVGLVRILCFWVFWVVVIIVRSLCWVWLKLFVRLFGMGCGWCWFVWYLSVVCFWFLRFWVCWCSCFFVLFNYYCVLVWCGLLGGVVFVVFGLVCVFGGFEVVIGVLWFWYLSFVVIFLFGVFLLYYLGVLVIIINGRWFVGCLC